MTELLQQLVDGVGRGSIYALLALGIAVIFGVMHLVNFAHGELITVSAYVSYALFTLGLDWWVLVPAILASSMLTALGIEFAAFRWVRNSSDFTMVLTSFGVHFVVQALFIMGVSANRRTFARPGWLFETVSVGGVNLEIYDLAVIGFTLITLVATVWLVRRTMFGMTLRAAAEDFEAARLMGVRSNRVIRGAFVLSGILAGVAAVFWLMRTGQADPAAGLTPMLKGVLAALIGGLGSLGGAVLGGLALGLVEVLLISRLPDGLVGLTDGMVFVCIALLFVFRPQGMVTIRRAERV
ncbi:MAG: branched-chain amino acid ABC transporter permease [bacterium]|nr:branched-chain amino acid ABC transporter permease [bacterium]MCY3924226.1 branched-chain amino acid ABC transporter permease [bacterium]